MRASTRIAWLGVSVAIGLASGCDRNDSKEKAPPSSAVRPQSSNSQQITPTTLQPSPPAPPIAPDAGSLEKFSVFVNNYAETESTFVSLGLTDKEVPAKFSLHVLATDLKKTDSVIHPIVYEAILRSRLERTPEETLLSEVEDRVQFVFQDGIWVPVFSARKMTVNNIDSDKVVGVEKTNDGVGHERYLSRMAQGLDPSK